MTLLRSIRLLPLILVVAAMSAPARANEKSAPLFEDARRKFRLRDYAGALKASADAVAADPGDADAQILHQDLLRRDKPEKTLVADYKAAAAAKPDDPLILYLSARLLKPDEAVREFAAQSQKFPASPWPHEGRAAALDALGKKDDAAAERDAAVSANPREPRFRVSQARALEAAGQWAQAAESWKLAVGLRPRDPVLLLGLGEAQRRAGLLDDALQQFDAAAKIEPKDPEPPYRTGLVHVDARRFDDALKSLDASIALDKGYIDAYVAAIRASTSRARAAALAAHRDLAEADFAVPIDYGTKAVTADPSSAAAQIALGHAEEAASEVADSHAAAAQRAYETAISLAPATSPLRVEALVGKACALLAQGEIDTCLEAADRAIELDPKADTAYLAAGRALSANAKYDDAVKKYFNPGLKAEPNSAALKHARGVAVWQGGNLLRAKSDLEAAVQAEPQNGRYQLTLGELHYQLKNNKAAAACFVIAAEKRPRDPVAWRGVGRAYTALNEWTSAVAAYEEVVTLVEGGGKPADAGAGGQQPPANPPPANPAPPPAAPPAGPPPAGDPPKKDDPAPAPSMVTPKLATAEHLYLTLIYADHLNDKEKAKAHARKWLEQGGKNVNLDSWVQNLLADK